MIDGDDDDGHADGGDVVRQPQRGPREPQGVQVRLKRARDGLKLAEEGLQEARIGPLPLYNVRFQHTRLLGPHSAPCAPEPQDSPRETQDGPGRPKRVVL
eukprot:9112642-Pyramimonas_sp.AAC.1